MSKNILVAGGAGYIGSHAVLGLKEKGYHPVILDNLSTGHREAVCDAGLVIGDIMEESLVKRVLSEKNIDAVMHFAASSLVGESMENPLSYYHNNVFGAVSLLEAMKETGVKNIIFSSTAAVYGNPEKIPIQEDDPILPINPYGKSKRMIEEILQDCEKSYGIHSISLRYFNAAGADPAGRIGEAHRQETHLIPLVLQTADKEGVPVSVFGDDYDTPDGTCIRDYIHVTDLIEAHILSLEYLFSENKSNIFNLGAGEGFSVKQVIESAGCVCKRDIPVIIKERRPGDPAELVASAKKAGEVLGWRPRYSGLDNIIKSAWYWHSRQRENSWV